MKAMTTMVQGMKEQNSWDMLGCLLFFYVHGCNFIDDEVKRAINSDKR
jgi:hypothetical protein